ncbi:anti-sigma factor antagonist [Streptomyces sp. GC420]|nr:anti-sigma factor antagonist [Streptomyces sp. GC420]
MTRLTAAGDPGVLVVAASGDLDLGTVAPLRAVLEEAAEEGRSPVVLDLSHVTFADSTTLNVLLHARASLGDGLRLAAPSAFVRRVISLTGVDTVVLVYPTVEDALEGAPRTAGTAADGAG